MDPTPPVTPMGSATRAGNVWIFLAVALGGAWLVALPLWLTDRSLDSPLLALTALAMMFTPSVAVLVTWLVARRRGLTFRELAAGTGLGLGPRKGRTLAIGVATWVGVPLFTAVSVFASAAVGWYRLDVTGLSLFREQVDRMPMGDLTLTPETMALIMLGTLLVNPVLNAVPSFGEEWGWRGWLMPRLLPHGRLRAVLVSGVIWGAWHSPITLLGYNYAELGGWAAAMFVPFCVLFGAVLCWTRLVTGSVWPAVVGHGALNGSTFLVMLLGAAGQEPNLALVGPISVVGMALLAVIAAALFGLAGRASRKGSAEGTGQVADTVDIRPGDAVLDR